MIEEYQVWACDWRPNLGLAELGGEHNWLVVWPKIVDDANHIWPKLNEKDWWWFEVLLQSGVVIQLISVNIYGMGNIETILCTRFKR